MTVCDEIRLEEFHDGELAPAEAAAVQAHVGACASCARALGEIRRLEELLRSAPAGDRPEWDAYLVRLQQRLRAGWFRPLLPLAAAAALLVALAQIVAIPTGPEKRTAGVAALVDEHATATPARQSEIESRLAGSLEALKDLVRGASPALQRSAAVILARRGDERVREWLVRATELEPEDPSEWELRDIGSEPTDVELVGCGFELLRSARTRTEAIRILRKLDMGGANRAAHQMIVARVKELLTSSMVSEQQIGVLVADEVGLMLPDLVDLLDVPALAGEALKCLRKGTGKDFGGNRDAWRQWFDRRM